MNHCNASWRQLIAFVFLSEHSMNLLVFSRAKVNRRYFYVSASELPAHKWTCRSERESNLEVWRLLFSHWIQPVDNITFAFVPADVSGAFPRTNVKMPNFNSNSLNQRASSDLELWRLIIFFIEGIWLTVFFIDLVAELIFYKPAADMKFFYFRNERQ